jgi:polysaccharide biosynthesis protein PslH
LRILFISRWRPWPPNNGSKLRVLQLLRCLASDHRVSLLSFHDPAEWAPALPPEVLALDEFHEVPYKEFNPRSGRSLLGFLSTAPRSILDTYSAGMANAIRSRVRGDAFDLVVASQMWTAAYRSLFPGIPAIFEEVELGLMQDTAGKTGTFLRRTRDRLTWAKHRLFLRRLVHRFQFCTVASAPEQRSLQEVAPEYRHVRVIPNCIDIAGYRPFQRETNPCMLVFAGSMTYWPNHDAMTWFLREIYPTVKRRHPALRLVITGKGLHLDLPRAAGVERTGMVEDVRPIMSSATVSIAPLRFGGGTRLKILEAMALKTPVVATSKAVEGLDVRNGEHLLVADEPADFADALDDLLSHPARRRQLAENALGLVTRKYDWKTLKPAVLQLAEDARRT